MQSVAVSLFDDDSQISKKKKRIQQSSFFTEEQLIWVTVEEKSENDKPLLFEIKFNYCTPG